MTCFMPAAAIRDSRWVRNGSPAVGSIGFGADNVNGRSRVPLPPTNMTASTCLLMSPPPFRVPHHQPRAHRQAGPKTPAQRRPPRSRMPVGEVNVGAFVMSGQIARRLAGGGVTLVMQHFGAGRVDIEPAGPAHPVAEVDVLHVHEVALVEAADLLEGR